MMSRSDRRGFMKDAGVLAAGAAAWTSLSRAADAAGKLTVGVMGCARGQVLARDFAAQNVNIAYVCDPDIARAEKLKQKVNAGQAIADFRRILDDKSVDALLVAAPDHWHAPASLLAIDAGKHVYVEKPCSHNIREGRLMIEAARRSGKVMAVGSQSRSTTMLKNAVQALREGVIGKVLVAKAWNSQQRKNIGHDKPSAAPAGVDYDLWVGPAPMQPYQANRFHYSWHWWYDFGTGDIGNDGIHELDIAAWGLGAETHPVRVTGYGAKMFFDDDQQFPDTQYVNFEFPETAGEKKLLVYEQRIWSPYTQQGEENGCAFYGTNGFMLLSKHSGYRIYAAKDKLVREEKGEYSVPEHVTDFIEAVRTGRRPSADIEIGHRSATLAHLANILARTGRASLEFDPQKEEIVNDSEANALVRRSYQPGHWAAPKVS